MMRKPRNSDSFHQAIGSAIDEYSGVEAQQAYLIKAILRTDVRVAYLICFAVQNSRSRTESIGDLLRYKFSGQFELYWESCSIFLGKLTKFRNAIAHWHPQPRLFASANVTSRVYAIRRPVPNELLPIKEADIAPFETDCANIIKAIYDLGKFILRRRKPLPRKFQRPIVYQNQAFLRQPPMPKAPQPQRAPSVPKLSSAERRKKALKDARESQKRKS
jgi:hypothetical protein